MMKNHYLLRERTYLKGMNHRGVFSKWGEPYFDMLFLAFSGGALGREKH